MVVVAAVVVVVEVITSVGIIHTSRVVRGVSSAQQQLYQIYFAFSPIIPVAAGLESVSATGRGAILDKPAC